MSKNSILFTAHGWSQTKIADQSCSLTAITEYLMSIMQIVNQRKSLKYLIQQLLRIRRI
ncbi:MAG: hypothetical protein GXZ01_02830 [Clostridiaceae bacterium]|nr:hypothetical protein [Clostridiaceae bacterium]